MERKPAEDLPELYRRILDAVAELETAGHRPEAIRVRIAATAAYSRAWDAQAKTTLEGLLARARRTVDGAEARGVRRLAPAAVLRTLLAR